MTSSETHPDHPLLSVHDLKMNFFVKGGLFSRRKTLKALDGVSFTLKQQTTLGVVGESGCGKSTLGRAVLQLIRPQSGRVLWMGQDLTTQHRRQLMGLRREAQLIFQDPLASLNPRMTVGEIIAEPLKTHEPQLSRSTVHERVRVIMSRVGLLSNMINRYPHEFSGGQCQRIGVARAMILNPKMIVCDEPVSALDVSIQAQIINLLQDLQRDFGLALIFISHDLSIVRQISHEIMVLYLGKVMERASSATLYQSPRHPYTKALISAIPIPDPIIERKKSKITLWGDLPSPLEHRSGCRFSSRCPFATDLCREHDPEPTTLSPTHEVSCHHHARLHSDSSIPTPKP